MAAARRWRLGFEERPQRRGWREGGAEVPWCRAVVPRGCPGAEEVPWCYGGTEEVARILEEEARPGFEGTLEPHCFEDCPTDWWDIFKEP